MPVTPVLSLIVPTRNRTEKLGRMLHSLVRTAADPNTIEVVLVVNADDRASRDFRFDGLAVRRVEVAPGLSMGALNMAGYEAAAGKYLMLLNDDVIVRTPRWDRKILSCLRGFPDGIVLVHVNDKLFGEQLCTFPIVSRVFCELADGICPRSYLRYRIDDHIEDVFNLLWVLGERRTVYLADVVFEHLRYVEREGGRAYVPEEALLARDAPQFETLLPERKELAVRLKATIAGPVTPARVQHWRATLDAIDDSFALRVPARHRVDSESQRLRCRVAAGMRRIPGYLTPQGWGSLREAIWKRLAPLISLQPGRDSLFATISSTGQDRRAS
jgi:glycosyltransferase involved in cell wall biosynthesis